MEESEREGGNEGTRTADGSLNYIGASEKEMEEDDEDAGIALRSGMGKVVAGAVEPSSSNKNNQLIPPPSTHNTTTTTTIILTTTPPTVKKSFKATVMGAFKLPNLFQGQLHITTTNITTDNNTNNNNSNNNNDNNRGRRRRDRDGRGGRGGDRGARTM